MRLTSVVCFTLCVLSLSAHAANPLHDLQSSRGGVVIEYQRATAEEDAFARLSASSPKVRVVMAGDTPDGAGREVAAAYAKGLGTLFADVVVVPDRNQVEGADYVVEISLSTGSTQVEGSETVYGTRQTGVACKVLPDGTMSCNDMGSAPMAMGTRPTLETESSMDVTIRFLQRSDAAYSIVFEDAYSIRIPEDGCKNPAAAVATVATALGKAALLQEPLNIQLYSNPKLLRCESK